MWNACGSYCRGKRLDVLGREGVRAERHAVADIDVVEVPHAATRVAPEQHLRADQGHHLLAAAVVDLPQEADEAAIRLALRGAHREHAAAHGESCRPAARA